MLPDPLESAAAMKPTKRLVVLLRILGVLLVLAPVTPASATHILYRVEGSLQPQAARANQEGVATFWSGGSRGTYALVVEDIRFPGYSFDARNSTRTATVTR
jgi:hypothetical protein